MWLNYCWCMVALQSINVISLGSYFSLNFLAVGSEIWIFNFPEKYFATYVGPFSAVYFSITALSSGVYRLYFLWLVMDTLVAVMAFSTNSLVTSSFLLDKKGNPVGSNTDKLEGKLEDEPLLLALYKKYFKKTSRYQSLSTIEEKFNFTVLSPTVKL